MHLRPSVTDIEYILQDNATLMSTTDLYSYITYTNDSFVEVSGFTSDELIGQPHNVVRHPDMPVQVFADMWATLKKGEPWTGLIKNRRKNGDYYWVRANAVPIVRQNQTVGFMSIRTKASRQEINQAQELYTRMNAGNMRGHRFYRGLMVRRGAGRVFSLFKTLSLRWRIRSTLLLLLPFSALAFWLTGLTALQTAALTGVNAALFFIVALCLETQISRPMEKLGQQAQGLTALTRAVDELDDITRQNATLVHEGAQASANVKHQATRLVDAVAVFR